MKPVFRLLGLVALLAALPQPAALAHFKLLSPESWIVEDQRGDPQKLGPCGGTSANAGTPSGVVGRMTGGQTLHLKLMETIYHPGHYRVALAVNSRDELPADPDAVTRDSERGPWSVSAPIAAKPVAPVLADGLFVHTSKPTEPFEADVRLPNITCAKCTLQITEFMADHGYNKDGGYYYHHCADLQITADAAQAVDRDWPVQR